MAIQVTKTQDEGQTERAFQRRGECVGVRVQRQKPEQPRLQAWSSKKDSKHAAESYQQTPVLTPSIHTLFSILWGCPKQGVLK